MQFLSGGRQEKSTQPGYLFQPHWHFRHRVQISNFPRLGLPPASETCEIGQPSCHNGLFSESPLGFRISHFFLKTIDLIAPMKREVKEVCLFVCLFFLHFFASSRCYGYVHLWPVCRSRLGYKGLSGSTDGWLCPRPETCLLFPFLKLVLPWCMKLGTLKISIVRWKLRYSKRRNIRLILDIS